MSDKPVRDHRGDRSYEDRLKNWQDAQRKATIASNRERTQADGLKPGPSGRPVQTFIQANSRADGREIAKSIGHGRTPVHDTAHAPNQDPHWHVTNASGQRADKNSPHVTYTQRNASLPSPKLGRKNAPQ